MRFKTLPVSLPTLFARPGLHLTATFARGKLFVGFHISDHHRDGGLSRVGTGYVAPWPWSASRVWIDGESQCWTSELFHLSISHQHKGSWWTYENWHDKHAVDWCIEKGQIQSGEPPRPTVQRLVNHLGGGFIQLNSERRGNILQSQNKVKQGRNYRDCAGHSLCTNCSGILSPPDFFFDNPARILAPKWDDSFP